MYLHHCLNLGTETVAGLCHGILVKVAHQLLGLYHQGPNSVVRGFIVMYCNSKMPKENRPDD